MKIFLYDYMLVAGLRLTLMLEQDEYMSGAFSPTAGARIVLHDPAAPAFPENKGIDIHPGQMTSVAIKFVSKFLIHQLSLTCHSKPWTGPILESSF